MVLLVRLCLLNGNWSRNSSIFNISVLILMTYSFKRLHSSFCKIRLFKKAKVKKNIFFFIKGVLQQVDLGSKKSVQQTWRNSSWPTYFASPTNFSCGLSFPLASKQKIVECKSQQEHEKLPNCRTGWIPKQAFFCKSEVILNTDKNLLSCHMVTSGLSFQKTCDQKCSFICKAELGWKPKSSESFCTGRKNWCKFRTALLEWQRRVFTQVS